MKHMHDVFEPTLRARVNRNAPPSPDKPFVLSIRSRVRLREILDRRENGSKQDALEFIRAGGAERMANNISHFNDCDDKIALALIEAGHAQAVLEQLEDFYFLGKPTVLQLIQQGHAQAVAENLNEFIDLDQEVALALIRAKQGEMVVEDLERFEPEGASLDQNAIAQALIDQDQTDTLLNHLDRFTGLDASIAISLAKCEKKLTERILRSLDSFEGNTLSELIAALVQSGLGHLLAGNLDLFPRPLSAATADIFLEARLGWVVVDDLTSFERLDYSSVALRTIAQGGAWSVRNNLHTFPVASLSFAVAEALMQSGETDKRERLISNSNRFRIEDSSRWHALLGIQD